MSSLIDIRTLGDEALRSALVDLGQPAFRSKQISEWIWTKGARGFSEMTNLPQGLRDALGDTYSLAPVAPEEEQVSRDGTVKCAFPIEPGKVVEGVLIPARDRMTACISSQVGCSLSCAFCATGRLKLLRNLTAGEIVDQVRHIAHLAEHHHQHALTNIVYMGMGEPLLNYRNVLESVNRITGTPGLGMSPKRITVSTAGIAKMIHRLGDDEVKFNLALSLHAAEDEKRNRIMEINETNDLSSLRDALVHFHEKTGTRVTFEYILLGGFNDDIEDARDLARFASCVPCKVNLIEYNPIDDALFQKSDQTKTDEFKDFLENKFNMIVNVRRSRGEDIDAACGQLANKNKLASGQV
jgi:23S rRNA (adenine2503-C2)-methyltransferase